MIWYEDELEHGEIFYYPMSIENKITANLQTGNEAELRRLLDYVYAENCLRRQISDAMGKLLIAELKGTFLRATKNTDSARKLVDQLLLPSSLPVTGNQTDPGVVFESVSLHPRTCQAGGHKVST